jgi:hypothetical protein
MIARQVLMTLNTSKTLPKLFQILNEEGQNLGIIFRRCPVDFQIDMILFLRVIGESLKYPTMETFVKGLNAILPTKEDGELLIPKPSTVS